MVFLLRCRLFSTHFFPSGRYYRPMLFGVCFFFLGLRAASRRPPCPDYCGFVYVGQTRSGSSRNKSAPALENVPFPLRCIQFVPLWFPPFLFQRIRPFFHHRVPFAIVHKYSKDPPLLSPKELIFPPLDPFHRETEARRESPASPS